MELGSGNRTRLASDPLKLGFHSAVWSRDGTRLAYVSMKTGNRSIYIRAVNQVTPEEERWEAKDDTFVAPGDWTPDGKFLILTERRVRIGDDYISLLPVAGEDAAEPLVGVQGANVDSGQVSPDGRWIAYRSSESGRNEIYISSFPKPSGKLQVSVSGGVTPRWKYDGRELFYLNPDKMLMAAELKETGGSLQAASIRPLFEMSQAMSLSAAGMNSYDVTRDGTRFVVDSVITDESATPLSLVLNWTAELKGK